MSRPSSLDRFQGCILGAAIGDALGAPYEFSKSGVRIDETGYRKGIFNTTPGEATDDSTLLRFHAEALIKKDVPHYYVESLKEWYKSNPKDMGGQTRAAIQAHLNHQDPPDTHSCGNGSLMAVAPAGLVAHDPIRAGLAGYEFSGLTHPNQLCRYICGVYATSIYEASRIDERMTFDTAVTTRPLWYPVDSMNMGFAAIAAGLAYEALDITTSVGGPTPGMGFTTLKWVIGLGGDADTNASIAGALLGAYWGMEIWREPDWLVATLQDYTQWFDLASNLYEEYNSGRI